MLVASIESLGKDKVASWLPTALAQRYILCMYSIQRVYIPPQLIKKETWSTSDLLNQHPGTQAADLRVHTENHRAIVFLPMESCGLNDGHKKNISLTTKRERKEDNTSYYMVQ